MGSATINVGVTHNFGSVAARFERLPEEVTSAMRGATPDATRAMARVVERQIERIAGGVYWDIHTDIRTTADGAEGRVTTPPSRPHQIRPKDPEGWLVFEIDGRKVFTKLVHHPGSRPVRWASALNTAPLQEVKRPFSDAVGRALGVGSRGGSLPGGGL